MSNRRRPRPPASIAATAKHYRCGHCQSVTGRPRQDAAGIWHLDVKHDPTCPVLGGTLPTAPAGLRAVTAAAERTRARILYIGTGAGRPT